MNFVTCCVLVVLATVIAVKTVDAQYRFLRYAPMVERMIKQRADYTVESKSENLLN